MRQRRLRTPRPFPEESDWGRGVRFHIFLGAVALIWFLGLTVAFALSVLFG